MIFGGLFGEWMGHGHHDPKTAGAFHPHAGTPTDAGAQVNELKALQLPVVYAAIGIIADAKAQLPVDVFRREGKHRIPQEGHYVEELLNRAPNPAMTAFTMHNTAQQHAVGWGNATLEITRNGNHEPRVIWPLLPDRTHPEPVGVTGDREVVYRTVVYGESRDLPPDRVLHVPAMGFDGLRGYSPLWMAREVAGGGLAQQRFANKFFGNDMKSGGFIEVPGKHDDEATKRIMEDINSRGGPDKHHMVKVLEQGVKYHSVTIPPEDAQFLETRQYTVEEFARMYRIPLFMLQSHSKDTAWGTGIAEMAMGFLTYTMAPWLKRWEQEYERKLLTEAERRAGFYVKHNVAGLLRVDAKSRAEFYEMAVSTGWMHPDEVRDLEDLNPRDDLPTQQTSNGNADAFILDKDGFAWRGQRLAA